MNPPANPTPDPSTEHDIEWTTTTAVTRRATFTRQELAAAVGVTSATLTPDALGAELDANLVAFLDLRGSDADEIDSTTEHAISEVSPAIEDPEEQALDHDEQTIDWLTRELTERGAEARDVDGVLDALLRMTGDDFYQLVQCLSRLHLRNGPQVADDAARAIDGDSNG